MGFPKMHLHVLCRIWYSSLVPCCHNISIVTCWGDESIHFDPILKCSLCLSMSTHLRPKGILRKPNDFLLVSEGSVRLYWGRFTPFCLKESAIQMSLQNDDNANFLRVCVLRDIDGALDTVAWERRREGIVASMSQPTSPSNNQFTSFRAWCIDSSSTSSSSLHYSFEDNVSVM